MAEKIPATLRTEFGKGAARRIRRDNKIPAVLYGHGEAPTHLTLPGHETFLIIKDNINALLELSFEGKSELALVKDVQRDVLSQEIEHLDLLLVRRGEKVSVEVYVVVEGESAPGTIHTLDLQTLTVEADAMAIPESIHVSVEGLEDGTIVRVGDLDLPEGSSTDVDPETIVVSVSTPRGEEESEDEDEAGEGEAGEAGSQD
ncbi:50S ribosomal protein L25/general stress protein Ctc [Serinibacter salmoneus]|uniref:Large ribosomal subunit protein bL25 n=1 Tax=Serinibacter salmoneus TaxID=556530 RepID=A0A2A9D2K2_9MICO|nr:50S ribosomal protein L25/general stress protein Ctc [Serinibacter salmoneus]PFG20475.1 large subunit ribosomal protein L25 [Serinibacter salmoneus]